MPHRDEVDELLDRVARGDVSPDLVERIKKLAQDPKTMDRLLAGMKELGLDQIAGEPLRPIADYYVDKPGKFELRWPLPPHLLPLPFDALDRKTQFFVLFQEWTRRELEGMQALNAGDIDGARSVFAELAERAQQVGVNELLARSYEGLMRAAEKCGATEKSIEWSRKANAIRGGGR